MGKGVFHGQGKKADEIGKGVLQDVGRWRTRLSIDVLHIFT